MNIDLSSQISDLCCAGSTDKISMVCDSSRFARLKVTVDM